MVIIVTRVPFRLSIPISDSQLNSNPATASIPVGCGTPGILSLDRTNLLILIYLKTFLITNNVVSVPELIKRHILSS